MLLRYQRGCKSFADIHTVSNVVYLTYRVACEALGLIGNDNKWLIAFVEATAWAISAELRTLFTHMLLFCEVIQPLVLWETQWKSMANDIRSRVNSEITNPSCHVNDTDLQQFVLVEIQQLLNSSTPSRSLADFGLPLPSANALALLRNRLLMEETFYDKERLVAQHSELHSSLNSQLLQIYNVVMSSYQNSTGKTFLWTPLISFFRSMGKIVLAVAASGITSLLLPSGRTAHSRFKLPSELTEQSTCYTKKNTQLAELLKETTLIIWDEAPMCDRRCFESLDRIIRDIMNDSVHPFGVKSVLLGGNFRQTLLVKSKCSHSEIINSTLPRSYLWKHLRLFKLSENMRLRSPTEGNNCIQSTADFASWLLGIGDGLVGERNVNDPHDTRTIKIPPQYLLHASKNNLTSFIVFIYDDSMLKNPCAENLSDRAIVCLTNTSADEINNLLLSLTPGEYKSYISHDVMIPCEEGQGDLETLYPEEYLDRMHFSESLHIGYILKSILLSS